jgi:anti-sigma regulatory factor (Ser/Thr protein kinase)
MQVLSHEHEHGFGHSALFYAGLDEYTRGTIDFLRTGIAAGEPALVVVAAEKIALLKEELGDDAECVRFADMNDVGRNPARIIPAWREFVDEHLREGSPVRGIGEPIWPGRSVDELVECQRHEALLNLAFADSPRWQLLCPYDVDNLPDDVLEGARRNHHDVDLADVAQPFGTPLPPVPERAFAFALDEGGLEGLRRFVTERGRELGLGAKTTSLAMTVNELGANSLRYGGGSAQVRLWSTGRTVVCEVRDAGFIDNPLVGRVKPSHDQEGGRGVWLANQLCDLVQVRSAPGATTVRVRLEKPGPVVVCRTPWGEIHLDERQCDRVTEALWRLGIGVPGAVLVATKLTQVRRRGAPHLDLGPRESAALEAAL